MFKIIAVIVFACALFIQYSEAAPLQILSGREGHVPVYIRIGDTPLEEINIGLAEAFHESNIRTRQSEDSKPEEQPAPQQAEVDEKKPEEIAEKKAEEESKVQVKRQVPEQPSKPTLLDANIQSTQNELQEKKPGEEATEEPKPEETRSRRESDKEQPSKQLADDKSGSDQPIDLKNSHSHSPQSTDDSDKKSKQ